MILSLPLSDVLLVKKLGYLKNGYGTARKENKFEVTLVAGKFFLLKITKTFSLA